MASFLLVHHHGSKMLRSESNSSITQSPIGWQISHFLSLLHDPTCGMCVCTSECVLLVSACSAVAACVWALIVNGFLLKLHSPSSVSRWCFFFHACTCLCESHHPLPPPLRHRRVQSAAVLLSQHVNERFSFQVRPTIRESSILQGAERFLRGAVTIKWS